MEKPDGFRVEYIHALLTRDWQQRAICFYDPDGHMIEVAETVDAVCRRLLEQGCSVEEAARRTQCPLSFVENCMEVE